MATARIEVPREMNADFCRRHHIRKPPFFGSVLRDDFSPESDVDVLVEFERGAQVGLIALSGMEIEVLFSFTAQATLGEQFAPGSRS